LPVALSSGCFSGSGAAATLPAAEVNARAPLSVVDFYEQRLLFVDAEDGSQRAVMCRL
jgi:hypothetical protein